MYSQIEQLSIIAISVISIFFVLFLCYCLYDYFSFKKNNIDLTQFKYDIILVARMIVEYNKHIDLYNRIEMCCHRKNIKINDIVYENLYDKRVFFFNIVIYLITLSYLRDDDTQYLDIILNENFINKAKEYYISDINFLSLEYLKNRRNYSRNENFENHLIHILDNIDIYNKLLNSRYDIDDDFIERFANYFRKSLNSNQVDIGLISV